MALRRRKRRQTWLCVATRKETAAGYLEKDVALVRRWVRFCLPRAAPTRKHNATHAQHEMGRNVIAAVGLIVLAKYTVSRS